MTQRSILSFIPNYFYSSYYNKICKIIVPNKNPLIDSRTMFSNIQTTHKTFYFKVNNKSNNMKKIIHSIIIINNSHFRSKLSLIYKNVNSSSKKIYIYIKNQFIKVTNTYIKQKKKKIERVFHYELEKNTKFKFSKILLTFLNFSYIYLNTKKINNIQKFTHNSMINPRLSKLYLKHSLINAYLKYLKSSDDAKSYLYLNFFLYSRINLMKKLNYIK